VQIGAFRKQIKNMLDHNKLREAVNRIEDNKNRWQVNFVAKYLAAWIYSKIG